LRQAFSHRRQQTTAADAAHWIGKGFRALSLGSDIGVFRDAVRSFREATLQQ
jgi:hypothetical protein